MSSLRGCVLIQNWSEAKNRWAVQLNDRCVAVKEDNCVLADVTEVCKHRRMCRYGDRCWRPNCHFAHRCERSRAERWAKAWELLVGSRCPEFSNLIADDADANTGGVNYEKSIASSDNSNVHASSPASPVLLDAQLYSRTLEIEDK